MSTTAKYLVDAVLQRVRDPQALAHSRTFALARISDAQRFINGALNLVISTATLNTEATRLFYPITDSASTCLRLIGVRENGRDLARLTDLHQLTHLDSRWFRSEGAKRFEAWVPIGRDLVVIYPAKSFASSVTLVFTELTTALGNETDLMELPDEHTSEVLALTEAMLLIKQRDLQTADAALQALGVDMAQDMAPVRWHLRGQNPDDPGRAQVLGEAP